MSDRQTTKARRAILEQKFGGSFFYDSAVNEWFDWADPADPKPLFGGSAGFLSDMGQALQALDKFLGTMGGWIGGDLSMKAADYSRPVSRLGGVSIRFDPVRLRAFLAQRERQGSGKA